MSKKEFDYEKKADGLLHALGTELLNSRTEYFDRLEKEEGEKPPLMVEKPVKVVTGRKRISARRFLILVAVLILAMAIAAVSSTGVKEKMFNYFFDEKDGYTDIVPLEGDGVPEFELGYVPNGYKVIDEGDFGDIGKDITYGNEQDEYILCSIYKSEKYNASVDNDTYKRKTILVNDYQANLFYEGKNVGIIWQVGDYIFDIYSALGENETRKIAENIRLKQ